MAKKNSLTSTRIGLIVAVVMGVILFGVGFAATTYLASNSNDLRSQADVPEPYAGCPGGQDWECGNNMSRCVNFKCIPVSVTVAQAVRCGEAIEGSFSCASTNLGSCKVCQRYIPGPGRAPAGRWVSTQDSNCAGMACGPDTIYNQSPTTAPTRARTNLNIKKVR